MDRSVEKWHFYVDVRGRWHWVCKSLNGSVLSCSRDYYNSSLDCVVAAQSHGYIG